MKLKSIKEGTLKLSPISEQIQGMAALYALGALTQHEARAFENLLAEDNNDLAEELAAFDHVSVQLALAAPECVPSPSVRENLLAEISNAQLSGTGPVTGGKDYHSPFTAPVQRSQFFSMHADEGEWIKIGTGLTAKTLFIDQTLGTVTSLVKMAPGGALPPHRHKGTEQFFVLEGDCNVCGTRLGPGDFHQAALGSVHESTYTVEGTTFLLIAPADYEILQPAIY